MALALASKLGRDGALRAFTRVSASMSRAPSANQPISSQPRGSLGYRLLRHSRHLLLPACQACRAQRPKGRDKWALSFSFAPHSPPHTAPGVSPSSSASKSVFPRTFILFGHPSPNFARLSSVDHVVSWLPKLRPCPCSA